MGDIFFLVLLCYDDSNDDFPWSVMNGDVSFGYMLGMKAVEFVCLFHFCSLCLLEKPGA
jgi:hypothetical protein